MINFYYFLYRAILQELIDTEEEFGRDLQNVVNRYMSTIDKPNVPKLIRDNKDTLFGNLQQISEFHNKYRKFTG